MRACVLEQQSRLRDGEPFEELLQIDAAVEGRLAVDVATPRDGQERIIEFAA